MTDASVPAQVVLSRKLICANIEEVERREQASRDNWIRHNEIEGFDIVENVRRAIERERKLRFIASSRCKRATIPAGETPASISDTGALYRVSDADETEYATVEELRSHELVKQAQLRLDDLLEGETGVLISPEVYAKRTMEREKLLNQACIIINGLRRAGIEGMRDDAWKMWRVGIHSREWEELPSFRRIMLNPYMAAMARASKLAAVEYFLAFHEPWRYRMWTFTSGDRCKVDQLKERCRWMFRRISKLNAKLKKRFPGVEIVFRATEFGTLETEGKRGSGGDIQRRGRHIFYHPHCHCIVYVSRPFMSEGVWGLLIDYIHSFWKRNGERIHWDAGKLIGSARELVKYVSKPGDMCWLAEHRPNELGALYHALEGMRLLEPLGELRRQICARKKAGLTLARRTTDDGSIWLNVLDTNRSPMTRRRIDETDTAFDQYRKDVGAFRFIDRLAGAAGEAVQEVVKLCMPTARASRVKEPTVLVMGNMAKPDLAKVFEHPLVMRTYKRTREAWLAGKRLADMEDAFASRCLNQGPHGHIYCPGEKGGGGGDRKKRDFWERGKPTPPPNEPEWETVIAENL
ncbi:hypothetical protein Ga0100231_023490 [Opitutaceae bacterium TAV4]|uniref:hypothetical protein n=1 Tax=Geminisphaera colitermitum TaxID=1148786 RepID=UPI000158CFEF|nr:hypothetical protein [Geminisphaera colitermitum]RRJ96748.1 hypothetical protein Ga0100231_023490 [Opitutaceae bacterium TAV4]RRK02406.1 hypothetical protein Ga0100230_004475 [Opitutaceae bacterium TAV3]